ncbi:hypothetical protein [Paenochrobactrum glaciei]|uniref:hypothetical protein n=1 Tax=Paenochrobactrum glaciei TaxID=486407 RepID=UPI0031E1B4BA
MNDFIRYGFYSASQAIHRHSSILWYILDKLIEQKPSFFLVEPETALIYDKSTEQELLFFIRFYKGPQT